MARKKKTVENVLITGVADRGKTVGRSADGQVLFVDGAVPGDVVDVLVLRKKKSFGQGIVKRFKSYSEDRIEPFCSHFGECGGCKWQNLNYKSQLKHKHQTVLDAMSKIGKQDISIIEPILGSKETTYYRNKLEYSFSNKRWLTKEEVESGLPLKQSPALGFHRPGAFDKIVDVEKCYLQEDLSNEIRNFVRTYCLDREISFYDARAHVGMMRNLIVRSSSLGQWMVIVSYATRDEEMQTEMLHALTDKFPQITSLNYVINGKLNDTIMDQEIICFSGSDHIIEELGNIKYKISPKSFFQTNTSQAKVLYDKVVDFAGLTGKENVYDLYTGLGSIALYVAETAGHVVGIEEVEIAIEDARTNAKLNDIENVTFYAGDVKDILTDDFAEKHGKPDLVITDPPRAGMHSDVVRMLLTLEAPKMVYVSCNPATQARDLLLLSEKYVAHKMQPVDMFPHTHHIENIALLSLRS